MAKVHGRNIGFLSLVATALTDPRDVFSNMSSLAAERDIGENIQSVEWGNTRTPIEITGLKDRQKRYVQGIGDSTLTIVGYHDDADDPSFDNAVYLEGEAVTGTLAFLMLYGNAATFASDEGPVPFRGKTVLGASRAVAGIVTVNEDSSGVDIDRNSLLTVNFTNAGVGGIITIPSAHAAWT